MAEFLCHKCGASWESDKRQPGFKETCTACHAYLHCCKNCRFHLPSAHNQCHIPNTEFVGDRSGLNFCDEFEFRSGPRPDGRITEKREQAREKFRALFDDDEPDEGPPSFDDLF